MKTKFYYGTAVLLLIVAALAAALGLSSCGTGATVHITGSLEPQTVVIGAGESVTWESDDRRNHQIMSGAPPVMTDDFISPVLEKGDSWSHTFEEPGEYPYHDMRTGLFGIIEVRES